MDHLPKSRTTIFIKDDDGDNNNGRSGNNHTINIASAISTAKKTRLNSNSENAPLHVQFYSDDFKSASTSEAESLDGEEEEEEEEDDDEEQTSTSSSSLSSSSSSYHSPPAPDGGWGWIVVIASFLVNLIGDGITFSFGIIFVEFLHYFGEGKSKTAWIAGLFMAMPLLSGPIASFLADRFGCRRVAIFGAILAALGFVISSFVNSMQVLFLTFGVFAGFGLSLCYVAAIVIVAYYFDRRRSLATGLSVCGSGIGTFIFAPLTQYLLAEYGWRGTVLILAGFFLNICVCGALMRDLPWTVDRERRNKQRRKKQLSSVASSFSSHLKEIGTGAESVAQNSILETATADQRLSNSLLSIPTYLRNGEKVPAEVLELLSTKRSLYCRLLQTYPCLMLSSRSVSDSRHLAAAVTTVTSVKSAPPMTLSPTAEAVSKMDASATIISGGAGNIRRLPTAYLKDLKVHRHSLTYRGAMLNINRYRLRASSCPNIYRNSMTTIAKEKHEWYSGISEFYNLLTDMLDLSYFLDMQFLLFALSNFLLYAWYDVPYVYLVDSTIEMGFSETDATFLISIIGLVNMAGEVLLGWVGDHPSLNPTLLYAGSMFLCGGATALLPWFTTHSYTGLCVASGAFGLFISANYSLTSIILVELISIERFTNGYGLLLLVQGIANLVGPPLAGWIYDMTNSYDMTFYLSGIFIMLSGGLLLILPTLKVVQAYRKAVRRSTRCNTTTNNNFKENMARHEECVVRKPNAISKSV